MIDLVNFSGGKDSTALVCWAKENLPEFRVIFCDTGWEHPLTYAYVEEINQTQLNGELITLKSDKYDGFADMVLSRKMVPGMRSRFCTQELKIFPLHKYYASLDDDVTAYVGIRADESGPRSKMKPVTWVNDAGGYWMKFPLYRWTSAQCFALMATHGITPNPLYLLGAGRVGCAPCIMSGKRELRLLLKHTPEIKDKLIALEAGLNVGRSQENWRTFFRGDYIPARFCSVQARTKDGRLVPIPTAQDVFDYLDATDPENENQGAFWDPPSCSSIYNLCE